MKNKSSLPSGKSAGYQVRRAHRAFDRNLGLALSPYDLKTGYWYYLRALWQEDNITQRELSDHLNVTEQTTVTMIAGLEKAGLVVKEKNPNDKRKLQIRLTPKGRDLESKLLGLAIEINEVATKGLTEKELSNFLAILDKIYKNLMTHEEKTR